MKLDNKQYTLILPTFFLLLSEQPLACSIVWEDVLPCKQTTLPIDKEFSSGGCTALTKTKGDSPFPCFHGLTICKLTIIVVCMLAVLVDRKSVV